MRAVVCTESCTSKLLCVQRAVPVNCCVYTTERCTSKLLMHQSTGVSTEGWEAELRLKRMVAKMT